ncbi:hypothetical protein Trco_006367 [Trichoderma cornu-damae]|uniref:AA1-like domain-containing protein n=1 Tax=Trichoderma cornu-damae TaxID=654480 RepID=A0A9P8QGM3_9HYPO|nr:hypothetical protein Trco_006367 [Trichoderma cornu-damae]
MRLDILSLLAALPSAMATVSALSYAPPPELLAMARTNSNCKLPPDFHIKNFAAKSNETGPTASLVAYNFTFVDETTGVTTGCYFNSSSVSTTPAGLTPRYACSHADVKFIWEDDKRELTLVERICPLPNGVAMYEVAGSETISLSCSASGTCRTNTTDYNVKFVALDPVRDPTLVKYWVG